MKTVSQCPATIEDLYRTPGKAELIAGRIVQYVPTGIRPSEIVGNIYVSLRKHCQKTKKGKAFTDNLGYVVPELSSGRESFSPDVSYYERPLPENLMRFVEGPPTLAVEVRSENDYGQVAEEALAAKRQDYFEAGTQVIWDIDPLAEKITVYCQGPPIQLLVFHRGESAHAEPAVPNWQISLDEVFA